ncbi:ImmA/IrrE family metallo-endopeptidase [Sporosarcina sp. Marseille-Q4943]|uniref:ImmA/IrrE family metallo-endopeptidase n=1 Tax=Sporosarcina sp. Marseille-Q4943 TaxID=2942204 RepID=UPI00208DACE1|nr:ImmA/IrrE family metallo-endopeptidase [Sporosarcina sp. Marseille-Q4943]
MQLRQIHTDYWEERADKVLSHFHYEFPDEINIFDICRRYGIRVLPMDTPFINGEVASIESVKAFSVPKDRARRGTIFVKEGLDDVEKKLLVTEEFCHLYAHHTPQLSVDQYVLAKNEHQAKRMSAYLLMPQHFINKVYDAAIDEAVLISDIADYFLVTEEFAQYRLELIFNYKVDAFTSLRGRLGTLEWFE